MSHTRALVFVPPAIPRKDRPEWVHTILDPFSETLIDYYDMENVDQWTAVYSTKDIPDQMNEIDPYYVILPDGTLHRIDWYDEESDPVEKWHEEVMQLLSQYADHEVIVIYMHT